MYIYIYMFITHTRTPFHSPNTQYGTIADCYTEMGDFENAALNYDKYIRVMNTDGG